MAQSKKIADHSTIWAMPCCGMGDATMTDIQTRPELLQALRDAASSPLTADEVYRQRVSFIMGMLKDDSTVTRAKVTQVLAEQEGKPLVK